MYSTEEVNHILYHNRSSKLIENFLPQFEIKDVIEREKQLDFCKKFFTEEDSIEFEEKDFLLESNDIIFTPEDIDKLLDVILDASLDLRDTPEHNYLIERGSITEYQIIDHFLTPMSKIDDPKHLDILGCTTHPILNNILGDGTKGGGVLFPLIEDSKLLNVAVRRLDSDNKMKYNLAIPDIHYWGEVKQGETLWITEGLFDRMSMIEHGMKNVISASTPGLSVIHLMKILKGNPKNINIWADMDRTGLKHAGIMQKFFRMNNILCEVYLSEENKDPFDHFQNYLSVNDIYPVKVTKKKINEFSQSKNENFLEFLKNREF